MKGLLRTILIPLLASRPVASLAGRLIGYGIPIFMLHRMANDGSPHTGGITPEHLRRCLGYLVENEYLLISLQDLVKALANKETIPPKSVVFTMDDGFADQAEIAAPIFLEFNCPLTFFVITGMLDGAMWPWDAQIAWAIENSTERTLTVDIVGRNIQLDIQDQGKKQLARRLIQDIIKDAAAEDVPEHIQRLAANARVNIPDTPPSRYRPMNWDMARRLEDKGIQFAPHSVTHNILSRLSGESLAREISDSWQTIKTELSNPVNLFCYPTGRESDFGDREIKMLKDSGFMGAVATTPRFVIPDRNQHKQIFRLPRLALPNTMGNFIQCCTWIEYAKQVRHTGNMQG